LGFDLGAAIGLSRRYPTRLLEEWVDITQAARERFGHEFFKKSPMAFFVDSVSKAHKGRRTPPDWWHEVRKQELSQAELPAKSKNVFEQIRNELFRDTAVDGAIQDTSGLISTACVLKAIR
ncbi:MAG: hypothetical protein KDB23_10885, partial [Planctomycetales bacterium]|nr:hypothetical protein [Planctomycetales bacterium]